MIFFEKMYVGFARSRYGNSSEPRVLGFAIPYGDTAALKKRQATVNKWCDDPKECRIIDNAPIRGFKILEVIERYTTSNKLFRVMDPRGFELEISSENLFNILLTSTVVNGEIIDECLWAQDNKIYLIKSSDERYKFYMNTKDVETSNDHVPGEYYQSVGNLLSVFRYEGKFHRTSFDFTCIPKSFKTVTRMEEQRGGWNYYYRRENTPRMISINDVLITKFDVNVQLHLDTKSGLDHVYTEFRVNEDGKIVRRIVSSRKSKLKNLKAASEGSVTDEMRDFKFTLDIYDDPRNDYKNPDRIDVNISGNGYGHGYRFHANKEDAKNFSYDEILNGYKFFDIGQQRYYSRNLDFSKLNVSSRGNVFVDENAEKNITVYDGRK